MAEEPEISWTKVYTTTNDQDIYFIQALLEDHDIESVILNKKDSAYLIGDLELHVPAENAFEAVQLINQNRP